MVGGMADPKLTALRDAASGATCLFSPWAEGAPSAAWLEEVFAAERDDLAKYLESQHQSLLSALLSEAPRRGLHLAQPDVAESYPDDYTGSRPSAGEGSRSSQAWKSNTQMLSPRRSSVGYRSKVSLWKREWIWRIMHEDEDPEDDRSYVEKLVTKTSFELVVSVLIMANSLVMAFQMQYDGLDIGYNLGYQKYSAPATDVWGNAEAVFASLDYFFGVVFTIELALKIAGLKRRFLHDPWSYFDSLIVVSWLVEQPFQGVLSLPADASVLRAARGVRLLRLLRLIRAVQGFDELYLMTTTLKGSVWILAWSIVLIFTAQMLIAFALFFVLSESYLTDEAIDMEQRREVFQYFGTFSRATLSLFELTLANWPPVCRLLVENVSEWFMIFFLLHKLTMGFAVIGVITNGVFMQETFKVASTDDRIMVRQRERDVKNHVKKMKRLFDASDDNGDGQIDMDEFCDVMEDPEILTWLGSMDIAVRDTQTFFQLLDENGDGSLSLEELIGGILKLRGVAKSVDLMTLRQDLHLFGGDTKAGFGDKRRQAQTDTVLA